MNEEKRLINWVSGMSTLIAVLLIVIVVLDHQAPGVSRALAAKTIALTLEDQKSIEETVSRESLFEEDGEYRWYQKYMDYLYEKEIMDPAVTIPDGKEALMGITYGEIAHCIIASGLDDDPAFSEYLELGSGKKKDREADPEDFWDFYEKFRVSADPDGNVKEKNLSVFGAEPHEGGIPGKLFTDQGTLRYEGLDLEAAVDHEAGFLVRDNMILKVNEIISDEIVYENAWISGYHDNHVTVFLGELERDFPVRGVFSDSEDLRGQIGDLYLSKGKPEKIILKKDRISGTVLSVNEDEIEIAGYGSVPISPGFRIYRTYGVLMEQDKKDILVGYKLQEFVVANGEICAALTNTKPEMDRIRVLLMTTGFRSLFHDQIQLSCTGPAVITYGNDQKSSTKAVAADEMITIGRGDPALSGGRITIRPDSEESMITVYGVERGQGTPSYHGHMEITEESEGLLLLNEVDLEDYLKCVVPSEMPPGYGKEALKAQAVCARTYALRHIKGNTYSEYGAHVDDSTNFQVYNNTEQAETSDIAVNETFGQVLTYQGQPAETFYYSTSCGHSTDGSVWGGSPDRTPYLRAVAQVEDGKDLKLTSNEAFEEFIRNPDPEAFDADVPMFRWETVTNSNILSSKVDGIGKITGLTVTERAPGGAAKTVKVLGTEGSKVYRGQNKIRALLGSPELTITRQDGSEMTGYESLPSCFIYIEKTDSGTEGVTSFTIYGGGYGHGAGMSQNGAKGMAERGFLCKDILKFYYYGTEIMDIKEIP